LGLPAGGGLFLPRKQYEHYLTKGKQTKILVDESEKLEERLSALNFYAGRLNSAESLDKVYELTLDAIERTLGFEDAAFMVAERGVLREACQRGTSAPSIFMLPLDGSMKGITVRAALTRKPVLVPDTEKDKNYVRGVDRAQPARSELAVPVIAENKVLGILNVESTQLNAFDEKDVELLQILASHASTAMSNIMKRTEIEGWGRQLALLLKSSVEMMSSKQLHYQLQVIADAIQELGWRRVVLSVRDENLNVTREEDIVTAGLSEKERKFLWTNRQSGKVWSERFGVKFERFRLGGFFYLPWSDPQVRKNFSHGTIFSHIDPGEMVDWNRDDLLYAPLKLADGRIVGVVSIDDPADGKRPTLDSLTPLELFLNIAAEVIEKAHLHSQLTEYAERLEEKVLERTKELKEMQGRLLKSERLASIGELAGMVGHDLRNPLTGIAGATFYLKKKLTAELDRKSEEMVKLIEDDIQRCNKIIDDLLEYSREIKLQLTETDPKEMLNSALSSLKIPNNIVVFDRTQSTPRISIDIERMRRVFTGIIKNAFDAMPNGGTVIAKSGTTKENLVISFSDTGTGMSDEVLENLWAPLFTTKAKGMGFGLPICRRIIEAHGGTISVKTHQQKGTTFTITIPTNPRVREEQELAIDIPEHPLTRIEKAHLKTQQ
jgi:signal transduction histidine kinase